MLFLHGGQKYQYLLPRPNGVANRLLVHVWLQRLISRLMLLYPDRLQAHKHTTPPNDECLAGSRQLVHGFPDRAFYGLIGLFFHFFPRNLSSPSGFATMGSLMFSNKYGLCSALKHGCHCVRSNHGFTSSFSPSWIVFWPSSPLPPTGPRSCYGPAPITLRR